MKKQENREAPQEKRIGVIYARYSSERQTEQSIEGQLRVCYEYANRNDIVIVDTYIDRAMTGTNDNRADFQRKTYIGSGKYPGFARGYHPGKPAGRV